MSSRLRASEINGKRRIEPSVGSWSPDGEQLELLFFDLDTQASAIYSFELDSGDLHKVTPWRLNAGNPDYSPDGGRIVFNSAYEGQSHSSIYTANPDGSDRRRLNHPRAHYTFDPSFSPSRNQIGYVVAGRNVRIHLARMGLGGALRKRITGPGERGVYPAWGAHP